MWIRRKLSFDCRGQRHQRPLTKSKLNLSNLRNLPLGFDATPWDNIQMCMHNTDVGYWVCQHMCVSPAPGSTVRRIYGDTATK